MTSSANIVMWILFVEGMAVMESSAVAARELLASPMSSPNATTVTGQDIMLKWLKITAVPLGVFLIGACTWGFIENSVVWRSFTGRRVIESNRPETDEVRPAERSNDSSHDGSDHLEEGIIALSFCGLDNSSAMQAQILPSMQQPALQSPLDEGNSGATDAAPQL